MFRKVTTLTVLVACTFMTPSWLGAAPILWSVNGHRYDLVIPEPLVNWDTAREMAEDSTFFGVQGHLATVTSSEENEFLRVNFQGQLGSSWAWIGLRDINVEGQYEWVTGEAFSYSNWRPGEPNNLGSGIGEDHIHYQQVPEPWGWNDAINSNSMGFFVEYPTPEPSTFILAAIGLALAVAFSMGRRR